MEILRFQTINAITNYTVSIIEDLVLVKAHINFTTDNKSQIAFDCFDETLIYLFNFN